MSEPAISTDQRTCARCKRAKPVTLFPFRTRKKTPNEAPTRIETCEQCQAEKKASRTEKAREKQGDANKENLDPAAGGDKGGAGLSELARDEFLSFIGGQLGSIDLEANVDISSLGRLASRREKADTLALDVWEAMNLRFVYVVIQFRCRAYVYIISQIP